MFSVARKQRRPVCAGVDETAASCTARVLRIGDRCPSCLDQLLGSDEVDVRLALAGDPGVGPDALSVLASDGDAAVRLAVAGRPDTPLRDLQHLEHDADAAVAAIAGETLSAAFAPRAFDDADPGALFTPADIDALATPDPTGAEPNWSSSPRLRPVTGEAARRPMHLAPGAAGRDIQIEEFEDVIERLESLGQRLTSLELALSSTSDQLMAITGLLSELAAGEAGVGDIAGALARIGLPGVSVGLDREDLPEGGSDGPDDEAIGAAALATRLRLLRSAVPEQLPGSGWRIAGR